MKEIEDGYKYLGVSEAANSKEKVLKDTFSKEYERRLRLVLKSKLNFEKIRIWQ